MAAAIAVSLGAGFAQTSGGGGLGDEIGMLLADPGVVRAHWGVAVMGLDGTTLFGLNEGQLFQPASNAKLFTTTAAMAVLGGDATFTTRVVGRGVFTGSGLLKGDVVLVGGGDANLSGRVIPYVAPRDRPKWAAAVTVDPLRYLEAMADQVAATGLKVVDGDVVGDDTLFPWEPYGPDWSIDDAVWGYGAPVSALTVNDNQIQVTVRPGMNAGDVASVVMDPAVPGYYRVDASGLTTGAAKSGSHVQMERMIGSRVLRIYGTIATDAPADEEEVAIEDPAEYAAEALKGMLESRGIRVSGVARAQHLVAADARGFLAESAEIGDQSALPQGVTVLPCMPRHYAGSERVLAQHVSPTVREDVVVTNKVSQNLHAELLLHQLGLRARCDGSSVSGVGVVRGFLTSSVGIDPDDFVFYDGSGLSGHDLVTPRATARLLVWAAGQAWFGEWKRSLPVGGVDGSLVARFPKAPLKENVMAKTGTLGEARALSGYVVGASGKTVVFSVMVGNHTPRTAADRVVMDRIVAAIAASE
jgi:D-alanyl-D-alanine carboxypeptidase/D-alanyl-D-alanine-endopeptidase (penicillin-binding protein 4)